MSLKLMQLLHKTSEISFVKRMKPSSRSTNSSAIHQEKKANIDQKETSSIGASYASYDEEYPPLSSSKPRRRSRIDLETRDENNSAKEARNDKLFQQAQQDESYLPTSFGKKFVPRDNRIDLETRDGNKSAKQARNAELFQQAQKDESSLPTSFGKKFVPRDNRIDLETRDENKSAKEARNGELFQQAQKDESSMPTSFGKKYVPRDKGSPKYFRGKGFSDYDERKSMIETFDICGPSNSKSAVKKRVSLECNMEWDTKIEYPIEETRQLLRPGMILLSNYLSIDEQVEIVTKCRELGVGPGGFYQPSFQSGAKLRLQMLCLGKNWDPETKYKEQIRSDGSEPPDIPAEFLLLVERALLDSHDLIKKHGRRNTAEEVLPVISPDICIVNFYTSNGKLGLHQDRDESRESLRKGLPVVSFSIGDSAEFLYGDQRNVNQAERVVLESGDVLIFGGKSRHIYHGVTSIIPNSAPLALLNEAKLRPGRLNLTFRQF